MGAFGRWLGQGAGGLVTGLVPFWEEQDKMYVLDLSLSRSLKEGIHL